MIVCWRQLSRHFPSFRKRNIFSTMTDVTAVTDRELWCFVNKFRQLLSAGKTAKLVIDSQRGCARVNLEVFLDGAGLPQEQQQHHHYRHHARVHQIAGGPARARRRARRSQARQAAAQAATEEAHSHPPHRGQPTGAVPHTPPHTVGEAGDVVPHYLPPGAAPHTYG